MTENSVTRKSRIEIEAQRAVWRDTAPVVAVAAVTVLAMAVSDPQSAGGTLVWSALMLALAGLTLRAEVRSLRRADEYQRTLQLEALALGFVAVLLLLFIGGLLDAAGLADPRQWLQISFIGGILAWSAIRALKTRKA